MPRSRRPSPLRLEIDHVVLEVADPEASASFYSSVLGAPPVRLEEFRARQAPFLSARISAGTVLDLFPRRMWRGERAANPNHLCFTTDAAGVAAVKRRLARLGIPITSRSERNFGARGIGRSIYFADPDGISVEVRYYP